MRRLFRHILKRLFPKNGCKCCNSSDWQDDRTEKLRWIVKELYLRYLKEGNPNGEYTFDEYGEMLKKNKETGIWRVAHDEWYELAKIYHSKECLEEI